MCVISVVCGFVALTSCELDREPETVLADNTFWKSETDLRGACNKLYVDLPGFFCPNYHMCIVYCF